MSTRKNLQLCRSLWVNWGKAGRECGSVRNPPLTYLAVRPMAASYFCLQILKCSQRSCLSAFLCLFLLDPVPKGIWSLNPEVVALADQQARCSVSALWGRVESWLWSCWRSSHGLGLCQIVSCRPHDLECGQNGSLGTEIIPWNVCSLNVYTCIPSGRNKQTNKQTSLSCWWRNWSNIL